MLTVIPLNYKGCIALKHTAGQHLGNAKKRQIERDEKPYPAMKPNAKFTQLPTDNSISECGRFGANGKTVKDTLKLTPHFEIPKLKHFTVVTTM